MAEENDEDDEEFNLDDIKEYKAPRFKDLNECLDEEADNGEL